MISRNKNSKIEFGDFQTPLDLALDVCSVIVRAGFSPASIIEPTCGLGTFLMAALEAFPAASNFIGVDQNSTYVHEANCATASFKRNRRIQIVQGDFFATDWPDIIGKLPSPLLILGNPPWVTNATLGSLGGDNLPVKANEDNFRGIDALTGKANFDISEWMLRKNLQWLNQTPGMLAVLCKTTVARRVLTYAWSHCFPVVYAEMRRIDAHLHFGVSVDACLLVVMVQSGAKTQDCSDYVSLRSTEPNTVFGFRDGRIVADVNLYDRWRDLVGCGLSGWRSGIKHDCSGIFELEPKVTHFENGFGQRVEVETEVLFTLLKSSDLVRKRQPRKWLLVPQRTMSESPHELQRIAPKAWHYLSANCALLDKRSSSIYRNRPRFSIFGVGDYSFSPWKVAISGLYKTLQFVKISPFQGRSVVLDDTCYFFACQSEQECNLLHEMIQSQPAQEFLSALVFWDAKRPITAQILNLLDLAVLARFLGMESKTTRVLAERQLVRYTEGSHQQLLFRQETNDYSIDLNNDTDSLIARQRAAEGAPRRHRR